MTSSEIGIIRPDGSVLSVYCNSDGYVDHVGKILSTNYTNPTVVQELIKLGKYGISYLGTSIGEKHAFGKPPDDSYTGFGGRDRGEKHNSETTYQSLDDYKQHYSTSYAYAFHPETKTWIAFRGRAEVQIPGAKKFSTNRYDQFFDESKKIKLSLKERKLVLEYIKKLQSKKLNEGKYGTTDKSKLEKLSTDIDKYIQSW